MKQYLVPTTVGILFILSTILVQYVPNEPTTVGILFILSTL